MIAESIAERRDSSIGTGRWLVAGLISGVITLTVWIVLLAWLRSVLVPTAPGGVTFGGFAAGNFGSLAITAVVAGAVSGVAHAVTLGQRRDVWLKWMAFGCLGNILCMLTIMLVRPTLGPLLSPGAARAGTYLFYCCWMTLFLRFAFGR